MLSPDVVDAPETRQYLDDLVRVRLALRDRSVELPQMPRRLARLLLRLEEYEDRGRDSWGCWTVSESENFQRGALHEPEIDLWLRERREELSHTHVLEPLWPDGRRFAVCVTHDVDLVSRQSTPRQALRAARAGIAPGVRMRGESVVRFARPAARLARVIREGVAHAPSTRDTLERATALEADRGAKASYFFTLPPHYPRSRYDCVYAPNDRCVFRGKSVRIADVMQTLAREGFDVGLHGGYRAALEPGVLVDERRFLEDATGLEITTTRQHFLRWDIRSTPRLQEEAGLVADSSLGFNFAVGFRAGTSMPFRHFDAVRRRPLQLLEVPLIAQDGAMLGARGLGLGVEEARDQLRQLFDTVEFVGGVLTLLVHPDKLARPDWLALFEWSLDHAVERGAWFTSLRELESHWRSREAAVLGT